MTPNRPLARLDFPGGRSFEVALADLLRETTDGIVNAANGQLAHGGGVAAAISRAAGPELDADGRSIVSQRGPVPPGDAVMTTAGRLPFKGVIHAVGPCQGEGDEGKKLASAVDAALRIADGAGWTSLSFPAISSGIFGVPPDVCARAYVAAVRSFFTFFNQTPLKLVRLCLFPGPVVDAVVREMSGSPSA
jgi:putative ATPase